LSSECVTTQIYIFAETVSKAIGRNHVR